MYKEDYIGDDTRVITRQFKDRKACSVSYITTVEKRDPLGTWSLDDRKETYVTTNAVITHERIRKEQEDRLERERREREHQQKLEREKQQEQERQKEEARQRNFDELKRFNQDERNRNRERERERDRDYDRGYGR